MFASYINIILGTLTILVVAAVMAVSALIALVRSAMSYAIGRVLN